jgi:hypothetical protein
MSEAPAGKAGVSFCAAAGNFCGRFAQTDDGTKKPMGEDEVI